MMAAEFRKSARQNTSFGKDRLDLRTMIDREHSAERKLKLLARYAYLGVSDTDRLPCAFRTIGDEIEVSANRGFPYDPLVQADQKLVLGCGAALFRLRIAIQHVGHLPIVRTFPDPLEADRLAVVRLGPRREPTEAVEEMFERMRAAEQFVHDASTPVSTPPGPTAGESGGPIDLDTLRVDARREGAQLKAVRMPDGRTPVELIDASSLQQADADVRLVICTSRDLTPDHLAAGQALERILLGPGGGRLKADDGFALLNDFDMRRDLREDLGAWPQALLSVMA